MLKQFCILCSKEGDDLVTCDTCRGTFHSGRLRCKEIHDIIVKRHAALCHIAIDNTSDSLAGVLCRQCGKEARCDH